MKTLLSILLLFTFSAQAKIVMTTKNVCVLDGAVDRSSMAKLKLCLVDKALIRGKRKDPIYLYLNSPGGSIYDGLKFITFAKSIRGLETITEFAASMAAAIVEGIPGKRHVVENGIMMFHRASGTFSGQFETGELESQVRLWKKIVNDMEKMQAKRIGISLEQYKKNRINEWWLHGDENVKSKTADTISEVVCSSKLIKRRQVKTVRSFFGVRKVTQSACPLVN